MTDWRQIQARIRKARTSADPPGQLAELYERTHDAMVAFELAQIHEKAGSHADAARWYTAAAERFRRTQWKQKAEEALARLGAPIPVAPVVEPGNESPEAPSELGTPAEPVISKETVEEVVEAVGGEVVEEGVEEKVSETETPAQPGENQPEPSAGESEHLDEHEHPDENLGEQSADAAQPTEAGSGRRRKRRGRRGGRGRGKRDQAGAQAGGTTNGGTTESPVPQQSPEAAPPRPEPVAVPRAPEPAPVSAFEAAMAAPSVRTRAGDPALSSRMTQLESQLRRLLACSARPVDQGEEAPAGPGVFLITDTDQTSYYYIEACETLRVGIRNLLRGGRSSRDNTVSNMKEKLADHLGINEARVGDYLKDHCAVRWLQLDEGARLLAHFAVAVLRPMANE